MVGCNVTQESYQSAMYIDAQLITQGCPAFLPWFKLNSELRQEAGYENMMVIGGISLDLLTAVPPLNNFSMFLSSHLIWQIFLQPQSVKSK